jgi:dienelactone hydrolase
MDTLWGGADPFIARERVDAVDAVDAMAAAHPHIECHVHEGAGHAFDNDHTPRFHVPAARAAAWRLTAAGSSRASCPPAAHRSQTVRRGCDPGAQWPR